MAPKKEFVTAASCIHRCKMCGAHIGGRECVSEKSSCVQWGSSERKAIAVVAVVGAESSCGKVRFTARAWPPPPPLWHARARAFCVAGHKLPHAYFTTPKHGRTTDGRKGEGGRIGLGVRTTRRRPRFAAAAAAAAHTFLDVQSVEGVA